MGIRTTVVLDEDVLERVREKARAEAVPFRAKLNDLLRDALARSGNPKPAPFKVKSYDMGEYLLPFPIRISDLDGMDDEDMLRRLG